MHSLKDIKMQYPEYLHVYGENILREYLQYKVLEIIFDLNIGEKLSFLGGTALRIAHKTERFSLDLDFDNFNLHEKEFNEIGKAIKKTFELARCPVELEINNKRGSFHYNLKFLDLLYENNLSLHKNEKLLIKLDSQAHNFKYKPDKYLLKKFDILTYINVTPLDILLAQKISAIFSRKRKLGRDFYDVAFLSSLTKPNYDYLDFKFGIKNNKILKEKLMEECSKLNFKELARDIEPVVFSSKGVKMVTLFQDFVKQEEF